MDFRLTKNKLFVLICLSIAIIWACYSFSYEYYCPNNRKMIYFFVKPGCKKCLDFDMVWNQFENNMKQSQRIIVRRIDTHRFPEISKHFKVTYYPQVLAIYNDTVIAKLSGKSQNLNYAELIKMYTFLLTTH